MKTRSQSNTDAWGIMGQYEDALGQWHRVSADTRAALRAAMDIDSSRPAPEAGPNPVQVLQRGRSFSLTGPVELTLEDGTVLRAERRLPPDLPLGYHELRSVKEDHTTRLIVSPGRCHLPKDLRAWGWSVQLYALRSKSSWGMGDLADLRRLARWSARECGAEFLLLNPLGAVTPMLPQQASPYFPTSRRFRNPLYLRVEEVPGATESGKWFGKFAALGHRLNLKARIDRDCVFRLKMHALERLWARFSGAAAFDRFCVEEGEPLRQFAVFCVLAEHHGSGWPKWPARFRNPASTAVRNFQDEYADRIRFHQWLQWLLDRQLARAAKELPLMQDLPIGVDPAGADAWAWQDILAKDVTVGAPPDEYNTRGQDWGLPPFVPHKLRAARYEPFRQTIRAALRHAGGLRIDHVMGLFRLFWIPRNAHPREGAFVRYRADELLAILALESQRAGAVVVGEDLGTVEKGVRAELRRRNMLSYRLLWFESTPPPRYPRQAMAAVTTHDLFTIAGLWTGSDLATQEKLGLQPNATGTKKILRRLRRDIGLRKAGSPQEAIVRTHRWLAQAPCMMLAATLDDALGVEERPNMPGTRDEWPNWRIPLPAPLEAIPRNPLVKEVARVFAGRRPNWGRLL